MATLKTAWLKKKINGVLTKTFAISHAKSTYYDYANSKTVHDKITEMDTTISGKAASSHTHSAATTSANGFMSSTDKSKLDGIAAGANAYTHPSYTARTGVPTANQTPAFGGTFNVSQPVSDATGHITAVNSRTVTIPSATATTSAAGLMSASDKSKLDGVATGATKVTVDSALSSTSTNPVQNKVVNSALAGKANSSHTHSYAGSSSAGGAATTALACTGNSATATKATQDSDGNVITSTYAKKSDVDYTAKALIVGTRYGIEAHNANGDMAELELNGGGVSINADGDRLYADNITLDGDDLATLINAKAAKDGSNATGTWNIGISGNAATATKATQDSEGNTITNQYVRINPYKKISNNTSTKKYYLLCRISLLSSYADSQFDLTLTDRIQLPIRYTLRVEGTSSGNYIGEKATKLLYTFSYGITSLQNLYGYKYYTDDSGYCTYIDLYIRVNEWGESHIHIDRVSSRGVYINWDVFTEVDSLPTADGTTCVNLPVSEINAKMEKENPSAIGSLSVGYGLTALTNQAVHGHYNNTTTATENSTSGTSTGTAFVIGNGTTDSASNALRVTGKGQIYSPLTTIMTGADYAEYFEWVDGNPNEEDRVGYFVTFDDDNPEKIRIAKEDDYLLGIVSGMPSVIGNGDEDWKKRYILDDFGRYIEETFEYEEEYIDEVTGDTIKIVKTGTKRKENPEYDKEQTYIPRDERAEWSAVGMLGVLSVYDDGSCQVNGYCRCTNDGIATHTDERSGYKVIKRVTDNIVKVVFR